MVTCCCSHKCVNRVNKAKNKAEKVQRSNNETKRIKSLSIEELKAKEFLSVTEASQLIGCLRQNVYKLIHSGRLKATNLLIKKTIIRRCDLDKIFTTSESIPQGYTEKTTTEPLKWFDFSSCYTVGEVLKKYTISETALQNIIKRERIPKVIQGSFTYVPKFIIDKILN